MLYAESSETITAKERWLYTRGAPTALAIALHELLNDVWRMAGWNIYAKHEWYDAENGGIEHIYAWVQDRGGRAIDIHGMHTHAGAISNGDEVMQVGLDRLHAEADEIANAKQLVLANPAHFGLPDPHLVSEIC